MPRSTSSPTVLDLTTTGSFDAPARPGSWAAAMPRRPRTLVTFPGIDADWPRRLAGAVAGRGWLADWTGGIVDRVAAWTHEPQQQATGWFGRDLRDTLTSSCDPATAASAPHALAGTVLANLAAVRALQADGLAAALAAPNVVATGHSAGLINAAVLGGDDDAQVDAVKFALLLGVAASSAAQAAGAAVSAAMATAGDPEQRTPMAALSGPDTRTLVELLIHPDAEGVELAMGNTRTRHVLSGPPTALARFRHLLLHIADRQAADRRSGRHPGPVLTLDWEPLASTVPFHHSALLPAADGAAAWAHDEGIHLGGTTPVLDPATRLPLPGCDRLADVAASVLHRHHEWGRTIADLVDRGTTVVGVGDSPGVHALTSVAARGSGARVVQPETEAGRRALLVPGAEPEAAVNYRSFAPVRRDGRLETRHARLTGRSPVVLAGMTPTTVEAGIVAAAANAGHVSELAGGGQVTREIFAERITELTELLEPGHEVVFNALLLDPYLWDLHLGKDRLVQHARAAGAPLCGVTVSAGIPERDQALALLDEWHGLGLWLNAFKPGNEAQVDAALDIAAHTPHPLWLHLEGGAAGGHHSWEDLDDLLLATYHRIREHDNVVLCAGGGIGTPERAAELFSGSWSRRHGLPAMPVDAVLVGTAAMATAEATTSASVKRLLAQTAGHDEWLRRAEFTGGMTSGLSGLNADIHFVDNSASRAAALLDEVAADPDAATERRAEIVEALRRTAKPYFGDVETMTYEQVLRRFAELTAVGRHDRYQDGRWLDRTHRTRFLDLLQRTEARLHPADAGRIPTLFAEPHTGDDPGTAIATLLAAYPLAATTPLHPADADFFLVVCRRPGKPVPFVPVIDADVRRWYQSDALWQSHDDTYEADQVLVIPGPRSVAGLTRVDEPVAELLARFEQPAVDAARPARGTDAGAHRGVLRAVLAAPTVTWAGTPRPNPLHHIASAGQWYIDEAGATVTTGAETARLHVVDDDRLELALTWPALRPGDGSLRLPIEVVPMARGLRFEVTADALATAGRDAIALSLQGPEVSTCSTNGAGVSTRSTNGTQGSTNGKGGSTEGASAHSATLGAAAVLPDAAMRELWPSIFDTLAATAPGGFLDLVHASHELSRGDGPAWARCVGIDARATGYSLDIVSGSSAGVRSRDRFFVRQPGAAARTGAIAPGRDEPDWQDRPHLALGELRTQAPHLLEPFALATGDLNPIHRSDLVARLAGLPGAIVHGMWTSAFGQRAVVELACDHNPERLHRWHVTFAAPVLPGAEVTATVTRTGAGAGPHARRGDA